MVLEEERLWTEENIDTVDQKVREERGRKGDPNEEIECRREGLFDPYGWDG